MRVKNPIDLSDDSLRLDIAAYIAERVCERAELNINEQDIADHIELALFEVINDEEE